MELSATLALGVTVTLAVLGYIATYVNGLRLAERKDRLERLNRQLSELYGPLFALNAAGNEAWTAFRGKYRPNGSYWDRTNPPNREEAAAWRLWMTEVFMPLNVTSIDLIASKADLLVEDGMPGPLLDLCAHVAAYKPVLRQWEHDDYSQNVSLIPFPRTQLKEYLSTTFASLKEEQSRLIRAASHRWI